MKDFIRAILNEESQRHDFDADVLYENSPLIRYLDIKMGAILGNTKSRRSLASIYAIYSILHFYKDTFFGKPNEYKEFGGYDYTSLFVFCRGLYGGGKLQNHALNSRVNGEFKNKVVSENGNDLIVINESKYTLHIDYLYVDSVDISKIAIKIIEKYIELLMLKDNKLIANLEELIRMDSISGKKDKISELIDEQSEARIFEIISYSILKNHYRNIKVFFGYSREELQEQYLTLYKTGRTNANDGGIDFVMRPIGRFFQVTEVNNYDKYLLDIDKVMHFPITFVIKTLKPKQAILGELDFYIDQKSGGMRVIRERYNHAIEEIITINELKAWLDALDDQSVDELLQDINRYYRLELNLPMDNG
ncbi:MAG: hypothetical protein LBI19_07945 [Oscillospiraceae bacterium]|jgi:hypothetical protein|nr:hypothetical protein [Oscillospiraceae bacterium]